MCVEPADQFAISPYAVCEHNSLKSECKECKAASICEHNRRKTECKQCRGASICEHGRRRRECIDCGGSSICEHKTLRRRCKLCKGSSICEHNRRKNECRDCVGTSVCAHNKLRRHCIQCGGASICVHNRRRNICKECGGSSICEHGRRKGRCKECKEVTASKSEAEPSPQVTPNSTPPVTPLGSFGGSATFFPRTAAMPSSGALGGCGRPSLSPKLLSHVLSQQPSPRAASGGLLSPNISALRGFGTMPFVPSVPATNAPTLGGLGAGAKEEAASSVSSSTAALLALLKNNLQTPQHGNASALLTANSPASLFRSNSLPAMGGAVGQSLPPLPKSHSFTGSSALASSMAIAATSPSALSSPSTLSLAPGAVHVDAKPGLSRPPSGGPAWSRPSSAAGPSASMFDMSTNAEAPPATDAMQLDTHGLKVPPS